MKVGVFQMFEAVGVELSAPVECRGKTLAAGHILTDDDVAALRSAGVRQVTGVFYEPNDVPPATAADILLKAICGDFLRYTAPDATGYSALYADKDGVFFYEEDRLLRFNSHGETMSLMLVAPYTPVYKGQFLGNLKLFGGAQNTDALNEAVTKISGTGPLVKINPYRFRKIAYVQTIGRDETPDPIDRSEIMSRFGLYVFNPVYVTLCEHSVEKVENAVRSAYDKGAEVVFIQSPHAPIGRDDVVPMALKEASCDIDRMNWPLDAGVPMVLAHRKETVFVGYGASDFEKPAFDRFLRLLATGTLPPADAFPSLAKGSLSLESLVRQMSPEETETSVAVGELSQSDKIAVVVLAAGSSRRYHGANKLLEDVGGQPMLQRAVEAALTSDAEYVAVVTGYEASKTERVLADYDVKIVRNADYVSGVLGSIRLGLSVLPPDVIAAIVYPADMPAFDADCLNEMIALFKAGKNGRRPVVLPSVGGVRHNPVLWPRELFGVVKIVPEDSHWSPALIEHSDYLAELKLDDGFAVSDINTLGDMSEYLELADFAGQAEKDLEALLK